MNALCEAITGALKAIRYPGYSRDIVSFGLLENIKAGDGVVTVELKLGAVKPKAAWQIQTETEKALKALPQLNGFRVEVTEPALPQANGREPGFGATPCEATGERAFPDPDPLMEVMAQPNLAPGAGYGEDGPPPLEGPMGDRASARWTGAVPVFQWEVDPSDSTRGYGESELERGGWIYRTWWQVHPARLVYASISAIGGEIEEPRPGVRPHPVGRNVVVNLVYDLRRQGVVAVYGTALDFRPFVEVFLDAFGAGERETAGGASLATTKQEAL